MFFGIGGSEFVVLALIALIVLGPEKLPRYAADAARFLRSMRALVAKAREDVRDSLGPEFQDISLRDLDPKSFVVRNLFEGDDDPLGMRDDAPARQAAPAAAAQPAQPRLAPDERPPFDVDAT